MKDNFLLLTWRFVWNLWFKIPQGIRFILVGGFNSVFAYGVFCSFVYFAGEENRQFCLITQSILTTFVSYPLLRIFVFQSKGKIVEEYLKCFSTWIVAYFINAMVLELLYQFDVNVYFAQLGAQITAAFMSYFAFKYWALSKKSIS